jgi:hypothetical protein
MICIHCLIVVCIPSPILLRLRLKLERETSTRLFVRQTVNLHRWPSRSKPEMAGFGLRNRDFLYEKFRRSSADFEKSGINETNIIHRDGGWARKN